MGPGFHVPGVVSTNVPDGENKIFVGGLPAYLNEEQVQELLTTFGELKAFNLVRENGTGASKVRTPTSGACCCFLTRAQGFAFFEYVDPNVTEVAIPALDKMELGDRQLVVQRASVGSAKPGDRELPPEALAMLGPGAGVPAPRPIMPAGDPTVGADAGARILMMLNMVTPEDLHDDTEYAEIFEDVRDECAKFGAVTDVRVPRPIRRDRARWGAGVPPQMSALEAQRADEAAGVGRVYIRYESPAGAASALQALAGRSFGGRSIIATLLADDADTTPPLGIIFAAEPEAPPPPPQEE
jgi:splicing factor U2AF subunit